MKNIVLCILVLLIASPVFAKTVDLNRSHDLTRKEFLQLMLNTTAAYTKAETNDDVIFAINDQKNTIFTTILVPKDKGEEYRKWSKFLVEQDINFIAIQYPWVKDLTWDTQVKDKIE